jgi:hypothetical protein
MTDRITIIPAFAGCTAIFGGKHHPIIGWKIDQLTGQVDPVTVNGVIENRQDVAIDIDGFDERS